VHGATAEPARGENPNPLFRMVDAGRPLVAAGVNISEMDAPESSVVDFNTRVGGEYLLLPQ
jgi:hypothetical protein